MTLDLCAHQTIFFRRFLCFCRSACIGCHARLKLHAVEFLYAGFTLINGCKAGKHSGFKRLVGLHLGERIVYSARLCSQTLANNGVSAFLRFDFFLGKARFFALSLGLYGCLITQRSFSYFAFSGLDD